MEPWLSWDESALISGYESCCESEEDKEASRKSGWQWELQDDYDWLTQQLTEWMAGRRHWKADVVNFGWRQQSGYKFFTANDGRSLLREVLPKTDCTFKIFKEDGVLKIQNYHHDSPTWVEWYTISEAKEEEYP
jgi:hypothetical protein